MFWAERDTHNFATLLEGRSKLPIETLLAGIENTHAWHCFLARRDPDPVGRRRSAEIVAECQRMMARLAAKARDIEVRRAAGTEGLPASKADVSYGTEPPPWPDSSPLLGTAGSKRERDRRDKRIAAERLRTIREVSTSPKPKGSKLQ